MARAALAPVVLLVVLPVGPVSAQDGRYAPGQVERERTILLGTAGSMLPESGALGPFGDLDGDGDVDFLAGARAHLNDGFGSFHVSRPVALAAEPRIAFFRADADGHLDLLTREHLYLGDGAGGFVDASANLPAGFLADAAAIADLDGDLDLDLVALERAVWPAPARVRLARNDGHGFFTDASALLPPPPAFPRALAAGDVDGDLDLDLVFAASSGGALWLNDGAGGFIPAAGALPALGLSTNALALVDVEGDTDLDLVLAGSTSTGATSATLLRNDGSGSYVAGAFFLGTGRTEAILVLDREDDGDQDLVFLDSSTPHGIPPLSLSVPAPLVLMVNDGSGAFSGSSDLPAIRGNYHAGFAGDVDGDGDADLVLGDGTFPHRLFLNDGQGSFACTRPATIARATPYDLYARAVALGDLDGDGLPDAFTPQAILLNAPPGVFRPLAATLPPLDTWCAFDPFPFGVAVGASLGDVDGDGDLDAYIAGRGMGQCPGAYGQSNRLWVNDGSARFTDETLTRLPVGPSETEGGVVKVALLDLDGDGDTDAACVRSEDHDGGGLSSCYQNDGTGVFTRKEGVGARSDAGAFGDLDADGDADYLEGGHAYQRNRVHRNDGSARFVLSPSDLPEHPLPLTAKAIALGDVDVDGDLDAYVCSDPGIQTFFYRNDGAGNFVDEPARLPTSAAGYGEDLAFADMDVDGDPDLLTATRFFLNVGAGFFAETPALVEPYGFGGRMAVGDVDLDGDPDLVLVDEVQTTVGVGFARHLESLGPARLGKGLTLVVHGTPLTPYRLFESLKPASKPLGALGWLLIDPNRIVSTIRGYLGPQGEAVLHRAIPASPALLGHTSYRQAFIGKPLRSTNLLATEIGAL